MNEKNLLEKKQRGPVFLTLQRGKKGKNSLIILPIFRGHLLENFLQAHKSLDHTCKIPETTLCLRGTKNVSPDLRRDNDISSLNMESLSTNYIWCADTTVTRRTGKTVWASGPSNPTSRRSPQQYPSFYMKHWSWGSNGKCSESHPQMH